MSFNLKTNKIVLCVIGSAILAFGLYNIHLLSGVTEGGILGMTLLLNYWLDISPAITSVVMNVICYLIGWKILGKNFILYSVIAGGFFSVFYGIFEQYPHIYPQIAHMPFAASIIGALFVGLGVGLCVKAGGAPGGDDALAMGLSKRIKCDIRWIYFVSDVVVLLLSLTYIDVKRIGYSLLTVILSGQIVGIVQKCNFSNWFILNKIR